MIRCPRLLKFLTLAAVTSGLLAAMPGYDLFIAAKVNRDYVVGSKIVTLNGVFKRIGDGEWKHLGENDTFTTAVQFDPRDRNVIYTTSNSGLWRSFDGGVKWRLCNDWTMTEARDVAVDPNAPDHVYVALPDGVAVSTDRAETLVRKENGLPPRGKYTQVLTIDRTQAGRVFAGCEQGLFLTENGADSWRCVLPTTDMVDDVQQSPHDPQHWVAVTQSAGAWASHDNGLTWAKLPGVPDEHALYNVTFDITDPSRLAISSWTYGVYTSEDGGATWTERNAGLPDPHRAWRVGVGPDGTLYVSIADKMIYASADFGRTWRADSLEGSSVNQFLLVPHQGR